LVCFAKVSSLFLVRAPSFKALGLSATKISGAKASIKDARKHLQRFQQPTKLRKTEVFSFSAYTDLLGS
jgi:hypothetical protein